MPGAVVPPGEFRMVRRSLRAFLGIAVLAVVLMVAAGRPVFAAPAPAATVQGSESLGVTVGTAFAFTVSTNEVTPGDNVSVTLTQTDDVEHTFTLSSVANYVIPSSDSTSQLDAFFAQHPPLVNFTIPAGQATYTTTFIAPPLGVYEYVCLIPGHFQAGMSGLLGSGEQPAGSTAPATGPGWQVFFIGGTIASLVIIALVLGFVVGRRRGSVHEMPPERLGYPEPPAPQPPAK